GAPRRELARARPLAAGRRGRVARFGETRSGRTEVLRGRVRASRLGDRAPARPLRRKRAARAGEGPAAERAARPPRESAEDLARSGARAVRGRRTSRNGDAALARV